MPVLRGWRRYFRSTPDLEVSVAMRDVPRALVCNALRAMKLTSITSVVALPGLEYQALRAQSVAYDPMPIVATAIV